MSVVSAGTHRPVTPPVQVSVSRGPLSLSVPARAELIHGAEQTVRVCRALQQVGRFFQRLVVRQGCRRRPEFVFFQPV